MLLLGWLLKSFMVIESIAKKMILLSLPFRVDFVFSINAAEEKQIDVKIVISAFCEDIFHWSQ